MNKIMFTHSRKRLIEFLTPRRSQKAHFFVDMVVAKDILSTDHGYVSVNLKNSKEMEIVNQHSDDVDKVDLSFFKILVAEDNLINQKIVQKMLEKMGVQFKIVNNGHEVIDGLRNEYFDLVLLDCYMSEMNGFETAIAIRNSKERFANIPLVAFSAGLFENDNDASRAAGMNDFILKPVSYEHLRLKIREWSGRIYESLPALDLNALEKIRIFDDEHHSLLRSLFQIYSENTQDELFKMRDLIQDGDIDRIRKKAHMLKSSAAQLGALRFEKFCILMEHDEDLDIDRAKTLLAEMCAEYENSRKRFSEYCQNLSQSSSVLM